MTIEVIIMEFKILSDSFDPVNLFHRLSVEASFFMLPVVVFVESSVPTLEGTSMFLYLKVDLPLFLIHNMVESTHGFWISVIFVANDTVHPSISLLFFIPFNFFFLVILIVVVFAFFIFPFLLSLN